ncbi:MAG: DUF4838 domain-containing protein [Bacteroidaceae bacterium]|nr:DUF4838 domain-containing protein [Bacteroidaceae bacterium]
MKVHQFFFSVLLGAASLMLSGCNQHTLFRNGASEYSIVIAPDAPESEQYAAQELKNWIAQVSGVELPITDLQGGQAGKRLVVGYNAITEELVPSAEKPSDRDDAFTWCNEGGDILFWGGSKRGTLYSVYSFLEEELGCRWYSSKVSVAPKRETWSFGTLYNHEEPSLMIRDNCVLDVRNQPVFSARMRNNFVKLPSLDGKGTIAGTAEGYWGVHAMGYFISPGEYYAQHPEYFSLIDGKRQESYAQLCLSNPEVLSICIEKIKQKMREAPDYLIYSMEQNDNMRPCQCEACQALVEKYGGESGLMVWFVNQVADAVKDEFPDKFVGTFAYQYTRHAPKDIVPRENVVIRLCSIECCMLHDYDDCEQNKSFAQDLKDWSAIAPHLYIWDYVTDFLLYCLPTPNWKTLQTHLQDYVNGHAIGILEEGDYQTPSCEFRELRAWLLSKLMWNCNADVDALIMDFTEGYYGAAAPHIREYLEMEDRILRREGMHTGCYATVAHEMYSPEFIREGRRIMAEARAAVADNPELLKRVEKEELPLCLLQMEHLPLEGIESGADTMFRRVIQQEGISQMTEFQPNINATSYIESFQKIAEDINNAPHFPAMKAEVKGEKGVGYTRYEGTFKSTAEMLANGKVVKRGTMPTIAIEEDENIDHFGYVFDAWLKVEQEGPHQLRVATDDGTVVMLDDKEIINRDGSHSPQTQTAIMNLEKGFHRLCIRYFDDHEGQVLDIQLTASDGYKGPLPEERLFLVE